MRPKLVWILWLDATLISTQWKRVGKLESKGCLVESAGFLVKEDRDGIYLSTDVDPDDRDRVRGAAFIPRAMIRKRKVFTVK